MVSNSGETISSVTAPSSSVPRSRPAFLQQQQHLEQVAHALGVRDDVVAERLAAVARAASRPRPRRSPARCGSPRRRPRRARDAQRPRVVQQREQQRAARALVERRVVGLDARQRAAARRPPPRACRSSGAGRPWRGGSRTPAPRASAAPGAARPAPPRGARAASASITRRSARKSLAAAYGVLRRDRVAQRLGAGELVQRRGQARVDADQRAAVGLVLAVRAVVGRARRPAPASRA